MLTVILNWLSGGLLDKILGFASDRERMRIEAMTSAEQRAHEERRAAQTNAKEVRIATAGNWEMRVLSVAIAFPFVAHLWAVWIDTQFLGGVWRIPKFPPPFDETGHAVLLSFFGLVGARALAAGIGMIGRK
jgi:hypothetical protein